MKVEAACLDASRDLILGSMLWNLLRITGLMAPRWSFGSRCRWVPSITLCPSLRHLNDEDDSSNFYDDLGWYRKS